MAPKFPLYLHPTGQWCKTIRGRKHYFGTDKKAALQRYLAEKDVLHFGPRRRPAADSDSVVSLAELGNLYAANLQQRVQEGEIEGRTRHEAIRSIMRLVELKGKHDLPAQWTSFDFDEIKQSLYRPTERTTPIRGGVKGPTVEKRSRVSVDGDIRRLKAFLNWCARKKLIPTPDYGDGFKQASAKFKRKLKLEQGRRDFAANDLRKIIDNCSQWFKPLVLLGANGGIGNKDLGMMKLTDYEGGEWLDYGRQKTGVQRRIWLWPETRQAIENYLEIRMSPLGAAERMFATKYRTAWYREEEGGTFDGIGQAFLKARRAAGVERGSFYDLRRTFQTIGDETGDSIAVRFIMAHAPSAGDMSSVYRQGVSDERIQRVCDHVRGWLAP